MNENFFERRFKMNEKIPAISVIAPMYNVEKYLAECLESVLNQTFKDFEFIITDDCSTDRSVEIVESYIPKFNGRLHLIKRKKNSGGAVVPRNTGLSLSRGKYIAFIDTDDMYTKTALEEFFNIAEETQADIVCAEKFFDADTNEERSLVKGGFVDEITIDNNDIAQRVIDWTNRRFLENPWNKLYRRDFIMEKELNFPKGMHAREDTVFSFYCVCLAEKIVRVPNIVNIYRMRNDSLSNDKVTIQVDKYLNKWLTDIIEFVRNMENFMNEIDFFVENPQFKYLPINRFLNEEIAAHIEPLYRQLKPYQLDELLRKEFSRSPEVNLSMLTYMFGLISGYHNNFANQYFENQRLKKEIEQLRSQLNEKNS